MLLKKSLLSSILNLKLFLLIIVSLLIIPVLSYAEMTGLEIMKKQKQLHEVKDEKATILMKLIDSNNNTKERDLVSFALKGDDGLGMSMMVFNSPADVKGTGLLTWEQKGREDDQWLYLPALGKEKRISSSGKQNKFMGTDFTYEDLRTENLDVHVYNLVGSETVDKNDCYVIEALPSTDDEKKESGYNKRKIWVRKDIFFSVKVEYFDKKDTLIKTQIADSPKNIQGTVWRSEKSIMKDVINNHKTYSVIKERAINKGLDKNFFSIRQIQSMK